MRNSLLTGTCGDSDCACTLHRAWGLRVEDIDAMIAAAKREQDIAIETIGAETRAIRAEQTAEKLVGAADGK
jgi:hypothetical protein